jgi:hypothetical protein
MCLDSLSNDRKPQDSIPLAPEGYAITGLSVCHPFQLSNKATDFDIIWYEPYAIEGQSNLVCLAFLQSTITVQRPATPALLGAIYIYGTFVKTLLLNVKRQYGDHGTILI